MAVRVNRTPLSAVAGLAEIGGQASQARGTQQFERSQELQGADIQARSDLEFQRLAAQEFAQRASLQAAAQRQATDIQAQRESQEVVFRQQIAQQESQARLDLEAKDRAFGLQDAAREQTFRINEADFEFNELTRANALEDAQIQRDHRTQSIAATQELMNSGALSQVEGNAKISAIMQGRDTRPVPQRVAPITPAQALAEQRKRQVIESKIFSSDDIGLISNQIQIGLDKKLDTGRFFDTGPEESLSVDGALLFYDQILEANGGGGLSISQMGQIRRAYILQLKSFDAAAPFGDVAVPTGRQFSSVEFFRKKTVQQPLTPAPPISDSQATNAPQLAESHAALPGTATSSDISAGTKAALEAARRRN